MRGHVRKRSQGSWNIIIDVGRDPGTGKRRQQWYTVKGTKKDAERELRERLRDVETGNYIKPSRLTLADWLNEWLDGYVEANCSPRTKESYGMVVRRYIIPELGAVPLVQVEARQLQACYSRLRTKGRADGKGQLSARTVRYCHSLLAEALGHGVKMGLLTRNVALVADPPRIEHKPMATLAQEDMEKFLAVASETPYYTFFYTLLFTGMRRGEALALRWKNVDLGIASLSLSACLSVVETAYKLKETYVIKEPKTSHSRRLIVLPPSLALVLRAHKTAQKAQFSSLGKRLSGDDLVFARLDGTPLDPSTVSHAFTNAVRKAGLPHIRLHDLRHTHATLMLKAGIHPKVVSERLGHSSIRITLDTYSHVLPGIQEAAAQRFDDFVSGTEVKSGGVSKMLANQS